MAFIAKEAPTGTVDGLNTIFYTTQNIGILDKINVDGIDYLGSTTVLNNKITLGDAPQHYIYVWYFTTAPTPGSGGVFTLADLMRKLNFALGTSETNLMTNEKRIDALNRSIQIILEQYAVPQYVANTALAFSSGVALLPPDCVQPLKLVDPTSSNIEYERQTWDKFIYNINQSCTFLWDNVQNAEVVKIYPTTPTSLNFWYVQNQPPLSNDTDAPRFNIWWEDAIVEKAAEQLLTSIASFTRAQAKQQVADSLIAKAWQIERMRITGPENNFLTSVFSTKKSLLNYRSIITTN